MTEKLLITIIAAIVVWFIKSIVSHFIKRSRLRAALLADIIISLDGAREQKKAVEILIDETLKEGEIVPFPIIYNVGQYNFYNSLQKDLANYIKKTELIKVIKFYQVIWEMDVSINGLAHTVCVWERDKMKLSKSNIQHLNTRKARICSMYEALSANEIRSLSDLPDDYNNVKEPGTVVQETPQTSV